MKLSQKCIRIFGGCILFFAFALAFATVVMAVSGQWNTGGSYSLVIQKQFDSSVPQEVLEEAKKQTYRFRVEGYRLDKDKNKIQINDIVEIGPDSEDWTGTSGPGAQPWKVSGTLSSEGPIHVSVTEITNDMTLNVGGQEFNMGDSRAEVANLYTESAQVRELNSNGKISLSRPRKKIVYEDGKPVEKEVTTTSVFRIKHEWPWDDSQVVKPGNWVQMKDEVVTLAPGSKFDYTELPAGRYTIEDLSVSGYKIQLGSRTKDVSAGQTGEFYINSKPGKLVITAGGTENDGGKHYFTINRVSAPDGAEPFENRVTQAVASKGRYEVTNLPRGKYEVTEYTFSGAPTKFKVKVPETEDKQKEFRFKDFTEQGKTIVRYYISMGGDYVDGFRYGPIYNAKGKMLSENDLYDIRYIADFLQQDGTTTRGAYKATNRKGNYYYTLNDTIIPGSGSQRLAFGVGETAANKGGFCLLKWTEHTRKEQSYDKDYDNIDYTFTVDERGWMEITAPTVASTDIGMGHVTYTYTLRKSESGPAVRTMELKPGETRRFEGLEGGSYFLKETVNLDQPDGFKMEISGDPFGSIEAGTSFHLVTMGDRTLTITKPTASDGGRIYSFTVERISGKELETPFETKTVSLKAGESDHSITLPEGEYMITPTDDMTEIFQLTCSDSTQVHAEVPSSQSSTVTFTNVFTPGTLGYRYVHEYYLKDAGDNKYSYEGCSPVTTVGGRDDDKETYGSIDVTKEPDFTFTGADGEKQTYTYAYMPDNNAYGYANSGKATGGSSGADDLLTSNRSVEKGTENPIYYKVDNDLTGKKYIGVDDTKSQIIILRYFRVLPEDQKGKYNYVHVYYLRNKDGTVTWEGTSDIQESTGQLGLSYPAKNIPLVPDYKPEGQDNTYHYVHNNRPTCGILTDDPKDTNAALIEGMATNNPDAQQRYYPNSNSDSVIATEDGKQIIILRYYREEAPVVTNGTYKVVHEYYFREKLEDQGDTEEDSGSEDSGMGDDAQPSETEPDGNEILTASLSAKPDAGGSSDSGTASAAASTGFGADNNLTDPLPAGDEGGNAPAGPLPSEDAGGSPRTETLSEEDESGTILVDTRSAEDESGSAPADTQPAEDESGSIPETSSAGDESDSIPETSPAESESGSIPETSPAESESGSIPETSPAESESGSIPETSSAGDERINVLADTQPTEGGDGDTGDDEQFLENSGGVSSFAGTLSSGDGYAYTFEGARTIETISAPLGSPHRGEDVARQNIWVPEGTQAEYGYQYLDVVYGNTVEENRYSHMPNMEWAASTLEGDQIIILRYYRDADTPDSPGANDEYAYRVVHEYYLEDADGSRSLEGRSEVSRERGTGDRRYDQSDVARLPEYGGRKYTYTEDAYGVWSGGQEYAAEAGKTYVTATANGEQIIILRYIRKASPEKPGGPGEPGRQPSKPSKTPTGSQLAQVPPTGDTGSVSLWKALAAASLCGLAVLLLKHKKTQKNRR